MGAYVAAGLVVIGLDVETVWGAAAAHRSAGFSVWGVVAIGAIMAVVTAAIAVTVALAERRRSVNG